ncbi:MAG: type II secretion system F family protein [Pseudobdellovibrionaceae bacterium]
MGSVELLLFGGLLLAGYSVYGFISAILTNNNDQEVLSWASGNEPAKSKSAIINLSRPIVHQFTLQHAIKIQNARYRKRTSRLILTSGLSRELNVDEFIGLQILWGIMFPILLGILNFSLQLGFPWWFILPLGLIGFYLPTMHANGERKRREISVRLDLPFFIDLLALSTEAGMDFVTAIQRIVEKAENSVLADELGSVLQDIKLGSSRSEALKKLADRLEMPEIISFVAVIVDADATGQSIAQVLKDQSIQIRLERFVRAEKAGARASQAILIPLMIFILPAVFVTVFAPIAIQFLTGGN